MGFKHTKRRVPSILMGNFGTMKTLFMHQMQHSSDNAVIYEIEREANN